MTAQDRWARWLLERRDAGDADARRQSLEFLAPIRDRVLDAAEVRPGEVVLDVGTGEGLLAFGALDRGARVIFSDVSDDLLELCREQAAALGVLDRCDFVTASATDLAPVPDGSVDVVTTRSVVIYLEDKAAAFRAFHRVLRPGGRLSIFEPINRAMWPEPDDRFWGYDMRPVLAEARKLKAVFEDGADATLVDFDERDLVRFAEEAGFIEVRLEYELEVAPRQLFGQRSWDTFLHSSGNPLSPTLAEAMNAALTPQEREAVARHLAPLVERGEAVTRSAAAYLRAVKGAASAS